MLNIHSYDCLKPSGYSSVTWKRITNRIVTNTLITEADLSLQSLLKPLLLAVLNLPEIMNINLDDSLISYKEEFRVSLQTVFDLVWDIVVPEIY